jgi:hypothetical protein
MKDEFNSYFLTNYELIRNVTFGHFSPRHKPCKIKHLYHVNFWNIPFRGAGQITRARDSCGQLLPLPIPWGGVGNGGLNLAFQRRICHLIYRNPQRPR